MAAHETDSVPKTHGSPAEEHAGDVERRNWTSVLLEDKKIPKAITGKAVMPVARDAEEYNMNHALRGKAIIFNQEVFTVDGLSSRAGTNKDRDNLSMTLRRMEFKVEIYNDITRQRLLQKLADLATEDHSDHDCLLVVVLSHGETDKIYANDGSYAPNDLWDPFTAEHCPTLAGKPKIFLIQACKGEEYDGGTVMVKKPRSYTQTDSGNFSDTYKIPNRADFLVVFSTFPGYFSWRNSRQGSWFIQSVCKVLDQHGHTKELLSMITAVSRNVALEFESQVPFSEMDKKKQIPFVTHTLIREVYFRPKTSESSNNVTEQILSQKKKYGKPSLNSPSTTRNTVDDEGSDRNRATECTRCCSTV